MINLHVLLIQINSYQSIASPVSFTYSLAALFSVACIILRQTPDIQHFICKHFTTCLKNIKAFNISFCLMVEGHIGLFFGHIIPYHSLGSPRT